MAGVQIMAKGKIKTVKLSDHITTGRAQWLRWHGTFTQALPSLIRVRLSLSLLPLLTPGVGGGHNVRILTSFLWGEINLYVCIYRQVQVKYVIFNSV